MNTRKLTLEPIKPRPLQRTTNAPRDIDPALWQRGCELWAAIRWEPLNSEFAVRVLIPLLVAADRGEAKK